MKKNPEFQYCFFDKEICAFDRNSLSRDYFADSFVLVDQLLSDIEEQCEFYIKYKKSRRIARIFEWVLGTVIPLAVLSSILGIMLEINILLWVSAMCLILFIILVLVVKIMIYRKVKRLFNYYDNIAKTVISIYNNKMFHVRGYHITYKTNNVRLEIDEKNKLFWIEFYKISKVKFALNFYPNFHKKIKYTGFIFFEGFRK
jgi:hypothetical protein